MGMCSSTCAVYSQRQVDELWQFSVVSTRHPLQPWEKNGEAESQLVTGLHTIYLEMGESKTSDLLGCEVGTQSIHEG